LDELLRRGKRNGILLQDISDQEAKAIEPRVKTFGRAIFSPTTSSVDPRQVMEAMRQDALADGVVINSGVKYLCRKGDEIKTSQDSYNAGYTINASGLYADKVAADFGFSRDYRILPFKGLYLYSSEPPYALGTNVYPVPDLANPFLGVHFTLTVDGHAKIGPTAIPAFWREQYSGLENFRLNEIADITRRQLMLLISSDFDFKRLALEEIKKYSRTRMVELASSLVHGVSLDQYKKWGKPGIRAQLLNIKTNKLEMDFVIEGDHKSMHVLNAVSPAFTCSLPFSQYICKEINKLLH
ncbi:MAG TPA: FAD-dependent oxidoreductase, partial [Gammaproteobacteria bacterium]